MFKGYFFRTQCTYGQTGRQKKIDNSLQSILTPSIFSDATISKRCDFGRATLPCEERQKTSNNRKTKLRAQKRSDRHVEKIIRLSKLRTDTNTRGVSSLKAGACDRIVVL